MFEGRLPAALAGPRAAGSSRRGEGHEVWEFEGERYTQVGDERAWPAAGPRR